MLGYSKSDDGHRFNSDVHYRLFFGRGDEPTVICMQDHDYDVDFDYNRLLSNVAYDHEDDAKAALERLKTDAAKVLGLQVTYVLSVKR